MNDSERMIGPTREETLLFSASRFRSKDTDVESDILALMTGYDLVIEDIAREEKVELLNPKLFIREDWNHFVRKHYSREPADDQQFAAGYSLEAVSSKQGHIVLNVLSKSLKELGLGWNEHDEFQKKFRPYLMVFAADV